MPPRRKRLNIDVMSSVVSDKTAVRPIILKPIAKKPIAKKPIAKKPIAKKPIAKKQIAKPRTRMYRLVKPDSSSSECNTPIYESPELLAAITETPEKPTHMHVCVKCFDYISSDNSVAYVTDEGLSYMHRTCEV